jgi:hypothetical protein
VTAGKKRKKKKKMLCQCCDLFTTKNCKWIVAEILLLGFIELLIYVPMFFRFMFRKFQRVHQSVISDIPGNPHVFNLLAISFFQTLPEPNNFNLVWTRVPLHEDLLVRGKIPFSRMSSWSIYGEGSDGVPSTIELHSNIDPIHRDFEVILTKNPEKYQKEGVLVVDTKDWKFAMCVMRNYLTPPGTEVHTPEIVLLNNEQKVVRRSQQLISGPATLHLDYSPTSSRITQFIIVNSIVWMINSSAFLSLSSDFHQLFFWNCSISFYSFLLFLSIYHGLYALAKKRLLAFANEFCLGKNNQLVLTTLKESSKGSQPSKLHRYWIMNYDIPVGSELSVKGKISSKKQKYWSLVIYDEFGLPIPQFVYDLNVNRIPISQNNDKNKNKKNHEEAEEEEEVYSYDIRMTHPNPNPNSSGSPISSARGSDLTSVDVSRSKGKGFVLFRLVHPSCEEAVEFSFPTTSLLQSTNNTANKRSTRTSGDREETTGKKNKKDL